MPSFFAPIKALYGVYQARQASKALRNLASQPEPTYRDPNSILAEAEAKTPTGYSGAEKAAFMNNLARLNTSRYRIASQTNPNMASNIGAGIDYGNVGAINEFAKNDAAIRRNKVNSLFGAITAADTRNTSNAIANRRMLEQQYGQAYQAGVGNVFNLFDQIDRDAASLTSIVTGLPTGGSGSSAPMVSGGGGVAGKAAAPNIGTVGGAGATNVNNTPYETNWEPYATPNPEPTPAPRNSLMQKWIMNPINPTY